MNGTKDFLLEIGTEEIPAGYIGPALKALEQAFAEAMKANLLTHGRIKTCATPRRLVLHAEALLDRQPDREVKIMGPPAKVAFDPDGNPTKAAEGFARKNGVQVADLRIETTEKGDYVAIEKTIEGRPAMIILQELLPETIAKIPFPKSMRWGAESFRFARPIRWLVCLLGSEVVPFRVADVASGRTTRGHRFMAPREIELEDASFSHYRSVLEHAFCIVGYRQRMHRLVESAEEEVARVAGSIVDDQELVELNTNLVEYPSASCGSFDPAFLDLPECVLITCMKEHQKYFAVKDQDGKLLPNFVAINNTRSPRPELVRKGHERVLSARLSDAAFFYKEDTKRKLEDFVPELGGMIFHQKLGTLLDKTERVVTLAKFVASQLGVEDTSLVERAARLCKADLCTEMVGEFPTLQGVMGKHYALVSGEKKEVAQAIEEHYLPARAAGPLPESMTGICLAIADKADTICATFAIGLKPTGTQDPYALRRQALGIIRILVEKGLALSLSQLVETALEGLEDKLPGLEKELVEEILGFIRARFQNDLKAKGFDHDVIEAAVRAGFDSPHDCYQRIQALTLVRPKPEFEPISIAFKRVMNILKGYHGGSVDPGLFEYKEEKQLYDAYVDVKEQVAALLREKGSTDTEAYEQVLLRLLGLKPHIDAFFDSVMVMVNDEKVRDNRLALLWLISRLFLTVGDLSAIATEG